MSKQIREWAWLHASAYALVLLSMLYAGGYFTLFRYVNLDDGFVMRRSNSTKMCRFYSPLAWCECKITGKPVFLTDDEAVGAAFYPE